MNSKRKKKEINWEKWGVIIAVVFGLLGLFGITFNCNSCTDNSSCASQIVNSSERDNQPSEEEIKEEIQKKTRKVWIEDMKILSHKTDDDDMIYRTGSELVDNTGAKHLHTLELVNNYHWWTSNEFYQELQFFTDSKYKTFSFTIALDDETRDTGSISNVSILSDGTEIWSKEISAGVLPEVVELDITGTTVLTIYSSRVEMNNPCECYIIFGDAYFTFDE